MNSPTFLSVLLLLCLSVRLSAQTIYVDVVKGRYEAKGTLTDPLAGLEQAVALASGFTGNEPVTIKVAPGLYVISQLLETRTGNLLNDTMRYTIEATVMPDDPDWLPTKMPVIQSISRDNSITQFVHSAGFLVAKNNVSFKGLKFTGNANPSVRYYYPVTRENETLKGLEISKCYFIGEKNSEPIQGAVWAHGAGIAIDHCIFYGCKNALLLFKSISGFSVTNSIIYGSYESAVWFGPFTAGFTFRNNIVSHCNYFWVRPDNTQPAYSFTNSLITGNKEYMGYYGSKGLVPTEKNSHTETGIRKTGNVLLSEVKTEGLPKDYLNLTADSDGKEIGAGIFKKPMK
ncbi:MAG: hypothetical protein JWM28_3339 [Chitinophagaceae bacterium]|nr:hypothetical protein [Chitinophagaceae bacterium]